MSRKTDRIANRQTTILIVDDRAMNCGLLSMLLTPSGYGVVNASDGEEALTILKREAVDIILLDVMMPGMNGFELCRRLKSDSATDSIPVVLITALDIEEVRQEGFEAGADFMVDKPVNKSDLLQAIQQVTERPIDRTG